MDNHTGYARGKLSRRGRQALCSNHFEGQGRVTGSCPTSSLTTPDRLRSPPSSPRTAPRAKSLHHAKPGNLPRRTQADSFTTMRVSGESGHTDDRVEECPQRHCQRPRFRSSNATLRLGLSPCSPRRSHTRTQDRSHSTSERAAPRLQPTAIPQGVDI